MADFVDATRGGLRAASAAKTRVMKEVKSLMDRIDTAFHRDMNYAEAYRLKYLTKLLMTEGYHLHRKNDTTEQQRDTWTKFKADYDAFIDTVAEVPILVNEDGEWRVEENKWERRFGIPDGM
jgi:hypothetical protein